MTATGGALPTLLYTAQGSISGPGNPQTTSSLWRSSQYPEAIASDPIELEEIGQIPYAMWGLAIDPDPHSRVMYGVTSAYSAQHPQALVTIDQNTGAGTYIGDLNPDSGTVRDITFLPDGSLVGAVRNGNNSYLVKINRNTGNASGQWGTSVFVQGTAPSTNCGMGVEYSFVDGYVYVFWTNRVYRVNAATGNIDEPNFTTNNETEVWAVSMDPTGKMYENEKATSDDTHFIVFDTVGDWYNPGGTVNGTYIAELYPASPGGQIPFAPLCFRFSDIVYQRIYGIPVEIDDNGTETVRELIVGIVGAP